MTKTDKQFGNQDTFLDTPWKALPESIQERVANGIEGITRSLLATIPVDLVDLLYVKGNDHRPGETGANTIMAALYMEVAHISESFFLEHIHTDAAMQYALNTETLQHQPFSANTFYRLRTRLNSIYEETGRDILEEITDMMNFAMEEEVIGNLPYNDLLDKVYRIDSLNISMHGKHMSRLELIYVINRMCINIIFALKGEALIPEEFQHYLEKQDHNRVIYFKGTLAELEAEAVKKGVSIEEIEAEAAKIVLPTSTEDDKQEDTSASENVSTSEQASEPTDDSTNKTTDESSKTSESSDEQKAQKSAEFNRQKRRMLIARLRLEDVVSESLSIKKLLESLSLENKKEYKLLDRVLNEQTKQNEQGRIIPRENCEIAGSSLQNPYDDLVDGPTCRTKDGKTTQGWTANVVQRCSNKDYAIIVDRDLEPNIHSDQAFARDFYQKFGTDGFNPETGRWSGLCCDGLYCNSYDLKEMATSRGFKVFCGTLTGIAPDPFLAGFNVDMKNMTVTSCPAGNVPKGVTSHIEKEEFRIRMPKKTCADCPNCNKCKASILKNKEGSILLKLKQYNEATTMQDLGDPFYREMVNKRNAVEGVPSVLRRTYQIDQTTYFGKWYARYDLMLATTAMNMRVLLRYRQDQRNSNTTEQVDQKESA